MYYLELFLFFVLLVTILFLFLYCGAAKYGGAANKIAHKQLARPKDSSKKALRQLLKDLQDPPILIGGRAMEYYGLRHGHDTDFIVSDRDYNELLVKYGRADFPANTPGVQFDDIDCFHDINRYDYKYLKKAAIDDPARDGYLIASKEDLILLKAITAYDEMHDPPPPPAARKKAFHDLQLLVDSLSD